MIFEKDTLSFELLNVIRLDQRNVNMFNSARKYDALSYRFSADTYLKTATKEYHVTNNSLCYVPAMLDYTRMSEHDELIAIDLRTSHYPSPEIECFTPNRPEVMAGLFRAIADVWQRRAPGYRYRATALLYEIFAECHAQHQRAHPHDPRIEKAVAYMTEHFGRHELSIRELADRVFLSEVYFRKLFKDEFGVSPRRYLVRLRVRYAAGLISAGYHSLKEVAALSGYDDYKYFSLEFKRIIGVSPSEYHDTLPRDGKPPLP